MMSSYDTPLWDGDLPAGWQGHPPQAEVAVPGGRPQGGCQKRNALSERRQGSEPRLPNGFDKETKTPVTCKQ